MVYVPVLQDAVRGLPILVAQASACGLSWRPGVGFGGIKITQAEACATYCEACPVWTGRFAVSHPAMPPAISLTRSNPLRCNKLAAMDDR